jgi:hypothetical protein
LTACELDVESCRKTYGLVGLIGLMVLILVLIMVMIAMGLDIYMDVLIRRILRYDAEHGLRNKL